MKQQLTVKEALEQGYTSYGSEDEFNEIEDIDEDDEFPHGAQLFSPIGSPLISVTNDQIREVISEWCAARISDYCNEQAAERAFNDLMKMDFSSTVDQINFHFKDKIYYRLTDIELIP